MEDRESKREEEREIIHTRFWESSQTRTREREMSRERYGESAMYKKHRDKVTKKTEKMMRTIEVGAQQLYLNLSEGRE